MRPRNVSHEAHVAQQCYRLQSLTQTLREEEGGEGKERRKKEEGGVLGKEDELNLVLLYVQLLTGGVCFQ